METLKALVVTFVVLVMTGCAASAKVATPSGPVQDGCNVGSLEERLNCMQIQNANLRQERDERLAAEKAMQEAGVPKMPGISERPAATGPFMPPGTAMSRIVGTYNKREGCYPGHNYGIANKTSHFLEVQGPAAMHPCGDGGLVIRAVRQGNGGTRPAYLVPPGGKGYFYFDPLQGGSGHQSVTVLAYGQSHIDGRSELTPLVATGGRFAPDFVMPADDPWGRSTRVTPDKVRVWE
ncbi:hypothetical protein KJ925_03220 [Patescibacteria group bacterium]|nr:hypothetical protein [Patescibacteria group bacterium]